MSRSADDAGLANARTALAWQRTASAVVAAAAVVARLAWEEAEAAVLPPLLLSFALGAWILAESRGRYARHAGTRLRRRARGGRAAAALTTAIVLISAMELAAISVSGAR